MSQHQLELILSRQFAEVLSNAVFLVDPNGSMLYYNEQAEKLLGKRFSETGAMPVEEWSTAFNPTDKDGNALEPEQLPLVKSMNEKVPAAGDIYIKSMSGEQHHIEIYSYPIIGRSNTYLGAIAMFWKCRD